MATGTFYIRPSADISLGHPVYPTTLASGYLAINEEVSDGSSTYIGVTTAPDGDLSYSSKFKMTLVEEVKITKVLTATLGYKGVVESNKSSDAGDPSSCTCTVNISGNSVFSGRYEHSKALDSGDRISDDLTDADMPNVVTAINNYMSTNGTGKMPEVTIDITNFARQDGNTKNTNNSYVTQIYIELECEYQPLISIKQNGTWLGALTTYKKVNGVWVETTENECKNYINSSFVIDKCAFRGHIQVPMPEIAATCTTEGRTGGTWCSSCGEIFNEPTTIPIDSNAHEYYVTGVCKYCEAASPDRISFTVTYGTDNGSAATFYVIQGLSWEEWVNGDKATVDTIMRRLSINGDNKVVLKTVIVGGTNSGNYIDYILDNVNPSDIIVADATYSTTVVE